MLCIVYGYVKIYISMLYITYKYLYLVYIYSLI